MSTRLARLAAPGRRRTVRLLEPGVQLRLPAYLLLITLLFGVGFAANAWFAYADLYAHTMTEVPAVYDLTIREQTHSFLVVSALIGIGYVATLVSFALAYTHWLVGPTVAIRRHLSAIQSGDYSRRLALRGRDWLFRDLGRSLNDLCDQLQRQHR